MTRLCRGGKLGRDVSLTIFSELPVVELRLVVVPVMPLVELLDLLVLALARWNFLLLILGTVLGRPV